MKRFSLLALLTIIIVALAFAGCGGGGGGGTNMGGGTGDDDDIVSPPDPGLPDDDTGGGSGTLTFITGRVVDQDSGDGVKNVTVIVTNKPELAATYRTKTTADGGFQVALQDGVSILSLFDPAITPPTFAIMASTAGTTYLDSTPVLYKEGSFNQGSIQFEMAALLTDGDLGEIGIKSTTPSGGGDIEPPPGGGIDGPPGGTASGTN